jgi:tetratricopeptide (TPR) repeat protein
MLGKPIVNLLFTGPFILFLTIASGQNLVNKKINISQTQEVMIIFPSKISFYTIGDKETTNLFDHGITNEKNLTINSKVSGFKTSMLVVNEGNNTHTFILDYKDRLNLETESVYNYSTRRLLNEEIKKLGLAKTASPPDNTGGGSNRSNSGSSAAVPPKVTPVPPTKTQQQIDEEHTALEKQSVAAYVKGNFEEAKTLLLKALESKPDDNWCKDQLRKTEEKILQKTLLEKEKATDHIYLNHKMSGDSAFNKKAYAFAKAEYIEAYRNKNGDRYVASRIATIEKIEKEEHYKQFIRIGKEALKADSLEEAEAAFKEALKLKLNDAEAKKGLAAVAAAKSSVRKSEEAENKNMMKLVQYRDSIDKADRLFQNGNYGESKNVYKNAKKFNPAETYPSRQIARIDSISLSGKAVSNKAAREATDAALYNSTIQKADKLFETGDLKKAKTLYEAAVKLRPQETYPAQRISTIDIMLYEAREKQNLAAAEQLKKENETRDYQNLIKLGNAALAKKQYVIAKDYFQRALNMRPSEPLPVTQLEIINRKLDEIHREESYKHFIHLADSTAYKAGQPMGALAYYDSAMQYKPQEVYPRRQIISIKDQAMKKSAKELDMQQQKERTEKFNEAFEDYRKADDARLQRKYTEAYVGFNNFLRQIDTASLSKYLSSESYYINQAKDYLQRLENYKPAPVRDTIKTVPQDNKKKRRNKRADNSSIDFQGLHPERQADLLVKNNLNGYLRTGKFLNRQQLV